MGHICTLSIFTSVPLYIMLLQPGSPVTGVLHITDIHYDPLYTPGLSNDCGEPLCCRIPNKPGVCVCVCCVLLSCTIHAYIATFTYGY